MVNYKKIYETFNQKFKEKIKKTYIDEVFPDKGKRGIELKRIHTKFNQDPEALTSDIIRELLRECKIDPLDIVREYVIEGSNNVFKKAKKKPDFFIESADPEINGLLFEIEHLNKPLDRVGDKEGIEQAREWYNIKPALFYEYDSIITNFTDWYLLRCNKETKDFDMPKRLEPWEIIEIIIDRKFGLGKEYIIDQELIKKSEITNVFYNGFQERLNKLLRRPSKILKNIEVQNYNKSEDITDDQFELDLIRYYRTIFSRLLFIKILKSWKMLPLDPLKIVFQEDKRHWSSDLRFLFFDVFNKKKKNRPKELPESFYKLPYLNGGLFRPSGIELDKKGNQRNVQLNPDAIKDIWDFFKGYQFLKESTGKNEDSNTINPEILGYIFERSIGDERKFTGSYYTREEITNYMVENTLFKYVIDKINDFLSGNKIKAINKISDIDFLINSVKVYDYLLKNILKQLRICDPACGSGAFLEKSAEKLLYLYKKCYKGCGRVIPYLLSEGNEIDSQMPFSDIYAIKKYIVQNNLYGVDINPSAIEICELRLWLWTVKPPESIEFSSESMELLPLPNIEYNLRCGNSLIGYQRVRPEKVRRIDESLFVEILKKKEDLINSYYFEELLMEEIDKEKARKEIDKLIEESNERLNKILLGDFKERKIKISAKTIEISGFLSKNFRKDLHKEFFELNSRASLTKFKINFLEPKNLKTDLVKGIAFSKEKKTNKIKSIFTTSKFNFGYYSEEGDHPLSKFIIDLIPDWTNVQNIKFEKSIDLNDLKDIKPFHWFMEFTEVFGNETDKTKGFDIIIGNPPFIRIENIDEPARTLYKENYGLAEKRFDIYILFYELSNNILKEDGYFGFVSSNKFLKSQTAAKMRKFIKNNFSIHEILNFNNYSVFHGVGIDALLIFLKKTKELIKFPYTSINYKKFILSLASMNSINTLKSKEQELEDYSILLIDDNELGFNQWDFYPKIVRNILDKITKSATNTLSDLAISNRQGVVTSANRVFIVAKEILEKYKIESDFCYKIVKGNGIRRWRKIAWFDQYLIYPYRYDKDTKTREKIDIIKDKDLNILKYLQDHKSELINRYCVKSGNKDWFELHDPVSPKYFFGKKIMYPDISMLPYFSVDLEGDLVSLDTNYSLIPKNKDWIFYLLAILCSFTMEIHIRFKFQTLDKTFRFKTFLVNEIPIIHPEKIKKTVYLQITNLAKKLYQNYNLELEKELNMVIKNLYKLNEEEYEYVKSIIRKHHGIDI